MNTAKKTFDGLTIIRLDTKLSHAVTEAMARVYFELSEPPPVGWSYIFTTVWQALNYPLKCHAEVEVDRNAIWIECVPEEVVTRHIGQLEEAVTQTNATYCEQAERQAFMARRQAESSAQFRARFEEVGRTLYPEHVLANEGYELERLWGSVWLARMRRAIFQN